ncbi:hypothetical protein F5884DRAFT_747305 [Xylogone sp. PMI_703]|nr:hypothetical protein F5884DRAFT_747305 [Xylogone sp. PMI_703]
MSLILAGTGPSHLCFGPGGGWSCGYSVVKAIDGLITNGGMPNAYTDALEYRARLLEDLHHWYSGTLSSSNNVEQDHCIEPDLLSENGVDLVLEPESENDEREDEDVVENGASSLPQDGHESDDSLEKVEIGDVLPGPNGLSPIPTACREALNEPRGEKKYCNSCLTNAVYSGYNLIRHNGT